MSDVLFREQVEHEVRVNLAERAFINGFIIGCAMSTIVVVCGALIYIHGV